jgi:hypothetical protein
MHPHLFRRSGEAPAPNSLKLWVLFLLVPACFAFVTMPPMWAEVAVFLTFGFPLTSWLGLHVHEAREFRAKLPAALRFATGVCVTTLGFIGLFRYSAALGCAALAAYVATALMTRWSNTPTTAASGPSPAPQRAVVSATDQQDEPIDLATTHETVRTMTDAELCQAWRSSFVALQRVRSPHVRGLIVQTRQVLLDEIDARHPAGLQAWLASGAQAAGGPDRFIDPGAGHPEVA